MVMVMPVRTGLSLSLSIQRLLTNGVTAISDGRQRAIGRRINHSQICCSSTSNKSHGYATTAGTSTGLDNSHEIQGRWKCTDEIDEYYNMSESFKESEEWTTKLLGSMLVYPHFVTSEEEADILKEIEPYMKRLHYESSHWDDAIHNYRETERAKWNQKNTKVIDRIRSVCFPPGVPQLRYVHILDLEKTGVIKPHIDSVRFCGNTIAGLSLLSDSIMRLRHDVQKDFYCDVLLPRLSLYVMKDFARYEFTHEILGEGESKFKNKVVPRDRRISVICRNEPDVSTEGPVFKPLDTQS